MCVVGGARRNNTGMSTIPPHFAFGALLRRKRTERGLSLGALADIARITTVQLSDFERGRAVPDKAIARALGQILAIDVERGHTAALLRDARTSIERFPPAPPGPGSEIMHTPALEVGARDDDDDDDDGYEDDEAPATVDALVTHGGTTTTTTGRTAQGVAHPLHYNAHPSGVECIEIAEVLAFCPGSALKYLWRSDLKNARVEDLRKALFYVARMSAPGPTRNQTFLVNPITSGVVDKLDRVHAAEVAAGHDFGPLDAFVLALLEQASGRYADASLNAVRAVLTRAIVRAGWSQ